MVHKLHEVGRVVREIQVEYAGDAKFTSIGQPHTSGNGKKVSLRSQQAKVLPKLSIKV
jgi:hypothetical protein